MRTCFWASRAAILAVLLASAGCNDVITGLSCNESTPCGEGASCERGVCVYLDPDSGAPAADAGKPDAGKPDAGKPGKDAGQPGPDAAVPGADAGAKPDTGPAEDVDGGADAGVVGDAGPSCQPNEEWVESGCVQVFEVQVVVPTQSHGTVAVILTRKDPRTTSPVPAAVEARWVRKKTMVGASLALVRTADQTTAKFEGSWALTESGVYEVQAAFELNGSYLSDPVQGKVQPAADFVPVYVKVDPDLVTGHCVFGEVGTITVTTDVKNAAYEKAVLKDPDGDSVSLSVTATGDCGTQHCLPCSDTVARCIVLQTDFFHGGKLGLETVRGTYSLDVKVKDDESSEASALGDIMVSRWARKVASQTAGMAAHAPLVVLSDGTVLAALSDRLPDPLQVAGARELVAITPGGVVVQGPSGSGSVRTLSVVENGAVAHLAMVTVHGAVAADQATYAVWYVTYSNGAFGNPVPVNVGNGKQTRGVGVAWRAADLGTTPVLAFVASEGGAENAHAAFWPAGGTQYSRGTMSFRIDPDPPLLTAGDRLFVGARDGNVHELVAASSSTVQDQGAPVGPGAPVVAMLKTTKLAALGVESLAGKTFVFQEGAPVTPVSTALPMAFVATTEDMLISAGSSLFTLPWGSSTSPVPESLAAMTFQRQGLLVGASGAVYLVGESSIGVTGSMVVRKPKGQSLSLAPSWRISSIVLGGAVLDCARTAPASTQGMLGLLHVPLADGRIVTLVVDDPGPDLTPGAWPMPGHDGRRTYSYDGPRGCVP